MIIGRTTHNKDYIVENNIIDQRSARNTFQVHHCKLQKMGQKMITDWLVCTFCNSDCEHRRNFTHLTFNLCQKLVGTSW